MKLLFFCLFAAVCGALAFTSTTKSGRVMERRKLEEVLRELRDVRQSLQHSEQMLNTPPQNIEDCCCLSALQCYRASMQVQLNVTERKQGKLYRSLKHHLTVRGLDLCNTGNSTASCQTCDSHPKQKAREFFDRLESLIQRAVAKLSLD
ncbi:unnamed protein product [Ophioblennius macclurei]